MPAAHRPDPTNGQATGEDDARARQALAAHGLPARWRGRTVFVLVELGFGRGCGFLAAWRAFEADPAACGALAYWVSMDAAEAEALRGDSPPGEHDDARLRRATADLLPGVQVRAFAGGKVRLYLAVGELPTLVHERVGRADGFSLLRPPAVDAAPTAIVAAFTRGRQRPCTVAVAEASWPVFGPALSAAGFEWETPAPGARRAPGPGGAAPLADAAPDHPVQTVPPDGVRAGRARSALPSGGPDHRAQGLPARAGAWPSPVSAPAGLAEPLGPLSGRRIAVVGAGLAGCATAGSLAALGAEVLLIDRHAEPAQETSGNPAGLVHGVVHHPATPHARLLSAAAADAARDARASGAWGDGLRPRLLRLDRARSAAELETVRRASGLPAAQLAVADAATVVSTTGLQGEAVRGCAAWDHPEGGWVDPVRRCRTWARRDGTLHRPDGLPQDPSAGSIAWHGHCEVTGLEPTPDGWRVHAVRRPGPPHTTRATEGPEPRGDEPQRFEVDAVVVAAAGAASQRLLAPHSDAGDWPLQPVRGQLRVWPADAQGLRPPRVAVSSGHYALTLDDGRVLMGATSQPDDDDPRPRREDARALEAEARRWGVLPASEDTSDVAPWTASPQAHRAGVRWRTPDRLPIVGPVALAPDPSPAAVSPGRRDQPRFLPRVPGLYVFTALGSRGIAWAHWGAEWLAAAMAGLPAPVESSLLDRVDPARFQVAGQRRAQRKA